MARTSKASIETQTSTTSKLINVPMNELTPKTRRKKISTVDKKTVPIETIAMFSNQSSILGADSNKENDTHCSTLSSRNLLTCDSALHFMNLTAGSPIPLSIQMSILVRSSACLRSMITKESHMSHMRDKKIEIINIARHCLQKVSLGDSETFTDFQIANLCVGIYCLRSVNTTLISAHASGDIKIHAAVDRTIQLYFLSISLAENVAVECYSKAFTKQDNDIDTSLKNMYIAVHMCFGAYEGLGNLLQHIWNLPWMIFNHESPSILTMFPVPNITLIRRDNVNLESGAKPLTLSDFKNLFRSITSLCMALKTLGLAAILKAQPSENSCDFITRISQNNQQLQRDHFGTNFLMRFFDPQRQTTPPFQIVLPNVLIPWMETALRYQEHAADEALKEISYYCQRGHKILWDAAKDVDHSPYRESYRLYKLQLQEDSILMLLFHQPESEYTFNKLSVLKLQALDQVCKLASDSSSTYYKSGHGEPDDELIRFHQTVGNAIDDIVLYHDAVNGVYIDYCARRGVHLSRSYVSSLHTTKRCSCIFSEFPFPLSCKEGVCIFHGASNLITKSLALVYMSLCLKENLLGINVGILTENLICDYLSLVDTLGGFTAIHFADLSNVYRLMTVLDFASGSPQRFIDLDNHRLEALGSIFSRILIPVIMTLFRDIDNISPLNRNEIAANGIHILLKTVYILEKLEDFIQSDKFICMIVDLLHEGPIVSADFRGRLTETSVKSLSHVGTSRMGHKNDKRCVMPFIANISLVEMSFSLPRKIEYRISERYAHLSKLFQTHGMILEAATATALSVRYLVSELSLVIDLRMYDVKDSDFLLSIDETSVQQSSLRFPSYWPESFTSKCRPLLLKLVQLLRGDLSRSINLKELFSESVSASTWPFMKELCATFDDVDTAPVTKIIASTLFGKAIAVDSNILRLCADAAKVFFWEFIRNFDDYEPAVVEDTLDAVVTFFHDHGDFVSCIELNAITAVALSNDNKNKPHARRYLHEALRWCEGTQRLGATSMVYTAGMNLFYLQVLSDVQDVNPQRQLQDHALLISPLPSRGYDEITYLCCDCLRTLAKTDPLSYTVEINRMISLLTKVSMIMDYFGCTVGFVCTNFEAYLSHGVDRLHVSILRYANAFNLLGEENYYKLGDFFNETKIDRALSDSVRIMPQDSKRFLRLMQQRDFDESGSQLCSDIFMHTIVLEISAYLSNVEDLSCNVQNIDRLAVKLSDFDVENVMTQNSLTFPLQIIHELWMISCYNFIYNYYDKLGHILMAYYYVRRSCLSFQRILKRLERLKCRDESPGLMWKTFHQIFCSRTFSFHISARISDCYMRISSLHTRLGDPHKSKSFALLSAEMLGASFPSSKLNRGILGVDLFKGLSYKNQITYRVSRSVRFYIESLLLALPFDSMDVSTFDFFWTRLGLIMDEVSLRNRTEIDADWMRETIKDLLTLGDAFLRNRGIAVSSSTCNSSASIFNSIVGDGCQVSNKIGEEFHLCALSLSLLTRQQLPTIDLNIDTLLLQVLEDFQKRYSGNSALLDVIARVGRRLHRRQLDDNESTWTLLRSLQTVASTSEASSHTKALSLYHLGSYYLHLARCNGELHHLWEGYSNRGRVSLISSSDGNIVLAHDYFRQASSFAGPTSSSLSRTIMRCLALVMGPKVSHTLGYSASEVLHSSIGCHARIHASKTFESHPVLKNLFAAFDVPLNDEVRRRDAFHELYTVGSKVLPSTWNFISMSLCTAGEVLISAIHRCESDDCPRQFTTHIICIFPTLESGDEFSVLDNLLMPFNKLMERNNIQLSGSKYETMPTVDGTSSAKEIWWNERRALDAELKSLLIDIDEKLFTHACVKELVYPYSIGDDNSVEDDLRPVSGNLSLRFEAMCTLDESHDCIRNGFKSEHSISNATNITRTPKSSSLSTDHVVFLVLDEHFQSLPIENLPTFIESTVCRIPSLPFAIATLQNPLYEQSRIPTVDLNKTMYVLDPESNLAETRGRMHTFFEDISSKYGWKWNGFIGEIPSDDIIETAMSRNQSLYLFCGHGGGECILPRTKFEQIFLDGIRNKRDNSVQCNSAMVLMGCSSGRLVSVNAPRNEFAPSGEYHYEPDGAIISYLCAGTPCIVANLWDVTDRDIDRYFMELLRLFVSGDNGESKQAMSLAACVAKARSACKLSYIIGCAPIIYGVPIYKL